MPTPPSSSVARRSARRGGPFTGTPASRLEEWNELINLHNFVKELNSEPFFLGDPHLVYSSGKVLLYSGEILIEDVTDWVYEEMLRRVEEFQDSE